MLHFTGFPLLAERRPGFPGRQEDSLGDLQIAGSLHLPGAYRSLARPSSAPEPSHPPSSFESQRYRTIFTWYYNAVIDSERLVAAS